MDTDMAEYKEEFVNEAREHLQILNQSLLDLEHDTSNMDLLNNIFRAAHTLKGSSATMGFMELNKLTHRMENVLDAIRNGKTAVTSVVLDTTFNCFDVLESMIDEIDADLPSSVDVSDLVNQLDSLLTEEGGAGAQAGSAAPAEPAGAGQHEPAEAPPKPSGVGQTILLSEEDREIANDAINQGLSVFKMRIDLEDTCALKSVRAVMVLKCIGDHADILATIPGAEAIEDGEFGPGFDVIFGTEEDGDAIQESVGRVNEVSNVDIIPAIIESAESVSEAAAKPAAEGTPESEAKSTPEAVPAVQKTPASGAKKPDVVRNVQSVRVNIEKLDALVNMVGELVINKIRLLEVQSTHQIKELDETVSNIDRLTNDLRDEVMQMRMVPVDQIFNRFPRMVRDLAKKKDKEIEVVLEGRDIELDRTVLDEIGEPLVHLIRNCVDHGIESADVRESAGKPPRGVIRLIARREKNHVDIKVADDGGGIDPDKLRAKAVSKGLICQEEADAMSDENALMLIFAPGFSTAEAITDISGRGVGMDVVKTSIEALGGSVSLESDVGVGTTVTLKLPLTMAIIQALLVEVAQNVYAVPISSVLETIAVPTASIRVMGQQKLITLRGRVLPLMWVHDLFGNISENGHEEVTAVVVDRGGQQVGLVVDSLIGQQEIAIKSLSGMLSGVKGFAGATILGDGKVIMILDVASML
ncbi:MAG: chemotaxis protein CheA [Methanosarcinales archaeon]|nr:chemotaxis protein CheA [Methanosarcinales archaeon]